MKVLYRAETKYTGEEVEGYYVINSLGIEYIHITSDIAIYREIKPKTLQIKCTDGEWRLVDKVEIVPKEKDCECTGTVMIIRDYEDVPKCATCGNTIEGI